MIVTLLDKPTQQTTFADVIIGAFGITGVLVLVAMVLGAIMAVCLVKWNQRHRPEENHLPPLTS
jgi:ABC-type phosphate transport system permease subunit